MDADGDGFDERGVFVGEAVGQTYMMRRGTETNSAKAPWRRYSPGATPTTWRLSQRLTSPRDAEVAFAAVDGGIEGDAVAGFQVAYVGAEFGDFAGGLVAHDERGIAAAGGAVEAVDVAAADAAGADADQDVVGTDLGHGHVDHFEFYVFSQ